ncbi:MAG TPA: HNH endonuclease signature motif containing protein [Saprospiraceae bacterium]|nr:HNH endonuclease signature motif containing protein [Saprospiraceae bacterium]
MKITVSLRRIVAQRAGYRCEYCLTSEADSVNSFEVDHIFPLKHGGPTVLENLAYTCIICNRNKGSNLATATYPSRQFTPLYNPRTDAWAEHFGIDNGVIFSKTEIGLATIKVLDLNHVERIIERRLQIESGSYPFDPTSK